MSWSARFLSLRENVVDLCCCLGDRGVMVIKRRTTCGYEKWALVGVNIHFVLLDWAVLVGL
jgi:hypothetical protein